MHRKIIIDEKPNPKTTTITQYIINYSKERLNEDDDFGGDNDITVAIPERKLLEQTTIMFINFP